MTLEYCDGCQRFVSSTAGSYDSHLFDVCSPVPDLCIFSGSPVPPRSFDVDLPDSFSEVYEMMLVGGA